MSSLAGIGVVNRFTFTPLAVGFFVAGSISTYGAFAVWMFGPIGLLGSTNTLSLSTCSNVVQKNPIVVLCTMCRPTSPRVTGPGMGLGSPPGVLKTVAIVV